MSLPEVRLVAIAGPPAVEGSALVDACRAAARGGATAVQVRMKDAPAAELLRVTEAVCAAVSIPVYVNDRADVALAARAHGVHLGPDDVPPDEIRTLAPSPFRIGISVGSPTEADAALQADVDYWSIGPIFATATKPDAGPPIGSSGFRKLARRAPADLPVIAIGGIAATNLSEVLEAGAAGVAVSRAVFSAGDIERATRALRDIVDSTLGVS